MSIEIDDNTFRVELRLYTDDARKAIKSTGHLRQILAAALEDRKKIGVKLEEEIDFTIEVHRRVVQREYAELEDKVHTLEVMLKKREQEIEKYDHEWGLIWHAVGNPVDGQPIHERVRSLCEKLRKEAAIAKLACRIMDTDDTYGSTDAIAEARRQLRRSTKGKTT